MADFKLIIGNKNYSSWSLRPWIWMKHIGIDFDERLVSLDSNDTDAKLAEYFSNQKVPILIHKNFEVWDSLAICEYLSELYPPPHTDPEQRAMIRALSAEMHASFFSLRSELPMNCRREPSPLLLSDGCLQDVSRIQDLWQHASKYSNGKDKYLFGSFSLADAMFAPVVLRLDRYKVELNEQASSYVKQMLQHPAMLEWIAAARQEKDIIDSEER